MAAFDFPDTTGAATDGSFQYDTDGFTYAWDGEVWNIVGGDGSGGSGGGGDGDELWGKSGNNIQPIDANDGVAVGNGNALIEPNGNISINGVTNNTLITFGNSTNWNAGIVWNGANDTGLTFNDSSDGSNAKVRLNSDELRIGTNASNDATTTIQLNTNGNAGFAGTIISGGVPYNGGAVGASLSPGGAVEACRTESNGAVFLGYLKDTDAATSEIFADGSAEFAGKINVGNSVDASTSIFYANSSQACLFAKNYGAGPGFITEATSGANALRVDNSNGTTSTAFIKGDGSIESNGYCYIEGGIRSRTQYFADITNAKAPNPANYKTYIQQLEGTDTCAIYADGTIVPKDLRPQGTLGQSLIYTDGADFVISTLTGGGTFTGGERLRLTGSANPCTATFKITDFKIIDAVTGNNGVTLNSDGTSEFLGSSATGDNNLMVWKSNVGTAESVKAKVNHFGTFYIGGDIDGGSPNTTLGADGTATFSHNIKVTPNLTTEVGYRADYTDVNYTSYIGVLSNANRWGFANYDATNNKFTFAVDLDGNADFAGRVKRSTFDSNGAGGTGWSLDTRSISIQQENPGNTTVDALTVYYGTTRVYGVDYTGTAAFNNAILSLDGGGTLDVKDKLTNLVDALTALKTAVAASTDVDSIKAAVASALTDF